MTCDQILPSASIHRLTLRSTNPATCATVGTTGPSHVIVLSNCHGLRNSRHPLPTAKLHTDNSRLGPTRFEHSTTIHCRYHNRFHQAARSPRWPLIHTRPLILVRLPGPRDPLRRIRQLRIPIRQGHAIQAKRDSTLIPFDSGIAMDLSPINALQFHCLAFIILNQCFPITQA